MKCAFSGTSTLFPPGIYARQLYRAYAMAILVCTLLVFCLPSVSGALEIISQIIRAIC